MYRAEVHLHVLHVVPAALLEAADDPRGTLSAPWVSWLAAYDNCTITTVTGGTAQSLSCTPLSRK
jgi:hypothetical protein